MDEVRERALSRYDAEDLLEALDITSEELLDRFEDKFINRLTFFEEAVDDDTEQEDIEEENEH
tara:strand:- start:1069 stop:1257 length:189 start_codon:yes stop_codon:yes gene_type:complete